MESSKVMKVLQSGGSVQIGTVSVINNKDEKVSEKVISLLEIRESIIDREGRFYGVLTVCEYDNRKVYQYISEDKMNMLGLTANTTLKPYVVRIRTRCGQGGTGEGMTLISYVVLRDIERGNKLLREYDYENNQFIGIDVRKVTYQNSETKLYWICEICGKKFMTLLNNRVGHSKSDCDCHRSFYQTSTNEELVVLMLKKSITNLKVQVPVFKDRRKVDITFKTDTSKFIVEYDGIFHERVKDYGRDLEARALGYTTIRIKEIAANGFCIDDLDLLDKEKGAYIPEIDRHTVICNYYKNRGANIQTLNKMFENLQEVLELNGITVKIEKVTNKMLEQAKKNRKENKKKIQVQ